MNARLAIDRSQELTVRFAGALLLSALGQSFSRFCNVVFLGGSPHQSISARAYQESFSSEIWARRREQIDRLLGVGHCEGAWNFEVDNALRTLEQNGLIPQPTAE